MRLKVPQVPGKTQLLDGAGQAAHIAVVSPKMPRPHRPAPGPDAKKAASGPLLSAAISAPIAIPSIVVGMPTAGPPRKPRAPMAPPATPPRRVMTDVAINAHAAFPAMPPRTAKIL
jgi:hypothetical protein